MCGIVGYVGNSDAKKVLLDGLERLEYRGYDSAGLAIRDSQTSGGFWIKRTVGPVKELVNASADFKTNSAQGIAHTRWATHGVPSEANAHPHAFGQIVLVHNGIIENHDDLRTDLKSKGFVFKSQTDTEVFTALIEYLREQNTLKIAKGASFADLSDEQKKRIILETLKEASSRVDGHYAIVLMVQSLNNLIFGIQSGAPLVGAKLSDKCIIASDIQPLLPHGREVSFIPLNSIFCFTQSAFELYQKSDLAPISFKTEIIDWSPEQVAKDGYAHYMEKEIFQQPIVVADTLSGRLPLDSEKPLFGWDQPLEHEKFWKNVHKVYLVACGTAYHAAMVAKYYFERWARIPVEVDLASEFRYRKPIFEKGSVLGVISQSGETADTLSALRLAHESGVPTFSICNVPGSTIFRESNFRYPTKAGPEIGVASTKAFTTQLTVLCSLALDLAARKGSTEAHAHLAKLPLEMERVLQNADRFKKIGANLKSKKTILFVGRGPMYPIALEGALKLKEITYRHAEGYAAGELKHGPIALVDKDLAAIVLAPTDELVSKTLSNLEEIKSRGAYIVGIGDASNSAFAKNCDEYIPMPSCDWGTAPMLYVLPLQLISYGLAVELGCSIDKPRNLAKSVTVE
jgi:glucosamine--fructose-6-phosphate aminotransferase (isomerizing)